ncbi:hypothetical protein [Shinella sp. M27]|uniref:hypothetical protein n=1 Tax=Shinella sp. M27 TaxID=3368614 RepID=UPI003BA23D9D
MSKIEEVAKAIYEADDVWSEAFPWPAMGSKEQSADNYRRIARAAVDALREPTTQHGPEGPCPQRARRHRAYA